MMKPSRFIVWVMLILAFNACSPFELDIQNGDVAESEHSAFDADGADEGDIEGADYYILGAVPYPELEACPDHEIPWILDFEVYQTPELPEPAPRTPFRDPVFGTCIIRVTDRANDITNPDDSSKGLKNEYARVQSFNADESLLLVRSIDSFWYLYDAGSLQPLGEVPVYAEPRWDAHDSYLLYYADETRLMSYDLRTGRIDEIRDFAHDFPGVDVAAVWTRYEGSPSLDTRYWGLLAQDADWESFAFLIYDMQKDTVAIREIPTGYAIDNVTISPLGNYFLASFDDYCEHGELGSDADPCGLMVYDHNLEHGRGLLRIIGHYDAALDAASREVILFQDIDTDHISMLDLASGSVTPLLPIDYSHTAIGFHFSGRAFDQPGWGVISTYLGGHPKDFTWMDDSIFALELVENGRVVRLAHTQSQFSENIEKDYWAEPHVSVNRDLTKIIFTSNWGRTGTSEVDIYMIALPDNWVEVLP
ncbi:MAG: hypothetical protein ABFS03_07525 [Chloroflexota bacterium]